MINGTGFCYTSGYYAWSHRCYQVAQATISTHVGIVGARLNWT